MAFSKPTQSIWSASVKPPRVAQLNGDLSVDVGIVGAGITGMTAAALLKRAGLKVAVLEREEFGQHGTTHRTSAHLTCALDQSYPTLIRKFDEQTAQLAVEASATAIDMVELLAGELGFDNEFRRVDGYRYTESTDQVEEIESDCEAARKLGLDAELVDEIPLGWTIKRGLRLPRQAQFHPLKHIFGLAKFVHGDGSFLYHKSPVRSAEYGERCRLETDRGVVTARHVILATHSPMGVWATLQTRMVPHHSYCLAIRAKFDRGEAPAGLFWDTADPYNYIRRLGPDDGDVMIVGGADSKTGHERDTRKRFDQMEQFARERFEVKSIEYAWSDQFFESADGLPYIGRGPGEENVYVATGYSGTGLTYGTASAMLISDLILGRSNAWEKAFDPGRVKPLASAKRMLENVGTALQGLVSDRFFRLAERDLSAIQPDEGKIVSADGQRLAVYRDEKGRLQAVSPVCTHLGCMVEWNNAEKHWDCKCHGSLFKPDGEPFAGPASEPLERKIVDEEEAPDESSRSQAAAQSRAGGRSS